MGQRWQNFKKWLNRAGTSLRKGSVLAVTNTNMFLWALVCLILVIIVSFVQPDGSGIWNQLLVAMGSAAAGCLIGFVYASFGKEREEFKPLFATINGVLGGAAITDLSKGSDSLIRSFIWSLAKACGYTDGIAIIVMIMLCFGTIGFLTLYYNRKLLLNPESAAADEVLESSTTSDPAGTALRNFWKPEGALNPANEQRLVEWLQAHDLGDIPLAFFLRSRDYAEQRQRAAIDLKLM